VFTVLATWGESGGIDAKNSDRDFVEMRRDEYLVLEPIADSAELSLTEADVRNNPRQVIDLIANLAGRLTKLERKHEAEVHSANEYSDEIEAGFDLLIERIDCLASANEQAISTVARNVETWAQETERIKHVMESPAPWAEDSFVIELSKKVSEIDAKLSAVDERTQPYQQLHDVMVETAKAINKAKRVRPLTAEERREL
jgi:hypothetical protein